jgi:hypothetical protein
MAAAMTPAQVACIVLGACTAAALVVAMTVQGLALHQRSAMDAQQGAAVAALQHAQSHTQVASTRAAAAHMHAAARAAAADIHRRVPDVQTRLETHMPFPCVTVIAASATAAASTVPAALVAAGFVPKKGHQQFSRDGVVVKLRSPGTVPPRMPTPPAQARMALRALDHVFGGKHYVQSKSASEDSLDTADGPAALLGDLCSGGASGSACGSRQ